MRRYRVIVTPWIGEQVDYYLMAENDVKAEVMVRARWELAYAPPESMVKDGQFSIHATHDYCYNASDPMPPLEVFRPTGTVDLQPK